MPEAEGNVRLEVSVVAEGAGGPVAQRQVRLVHQISGLERVSVSFTLEASVGHLANLSDESLEEFVGGLHGGDLRPSYGGGQSATRR